ncbi:hypothetical protein OKW96_14915 [Sphingobacterium sp. KU25419]|nr:hypothetical protein OKW96_14915 [Sphingobacterium sp. KU25419]
MVKNDYTRDVRSSSEAKDLLIKLQTDFANHLSPLVRDNTNVINFDLAKYKVLGGY